MARKINPKTPKPQKGQSSEDYWRERETRQRAQNIKEEAEMGRKINTVFTRMQDEIQQEIDSFYGRYASKEGITIADAKERVSKLDIEKYQRLAESYVKAAREGGAEAAFSDEANEQMRLYNATMRINRLEMLKARCGIRAMEGYRLADQLINEALEERAYSEYYRLAGILGNSVQFNENMVRSIVNASYQNATWSQRLWNNQALLSERIGAQIAQGILTGKGSDVLARNIQKLTGQSTYVCQRLMRTELRRVQTAAAEQSMLDNGVTEYKFLVANGINPCDECLALDGKVFKISEMSVGKNAPPKHPLCHCCTCPALDEEKWQRWLDGPAQAGVPWAEFESETYNNTKDTVNAQENSFNVLNYKKSDNILTGGAANSNKGERVEFNENAEYAIRIPNYSDALNKQLSSSARKVAKFGSDAGYEYSAIVDLNTGVEVDFGTSEDPISVNYYYKFLREHPDGRYAMIHNHNTESGLSLPDVQELVMWKNLDVISAVTNNGITTTIESNGSKTEEVLYMEFASVGRDSYGRLSNELAMVDAAISKYAKGRYIHDGRGK